MAGNASEVSVMADQDVPRMTDGPNIMCRMCGTISNHVTGLCYQHRRAEDGYVGLTCADQAYLAWKRQRDAGND